MADIIQSPREDPTWKRYYEDAIYFLAGIYAAEEVRRQQNNASSSGRSLSAHEIAEIFAQAAKYMTDRIQRTSGTIGGDHG